MNLLGFLMLLAIIAATYRRVVLPRLRKLAWWKRFVARVWAVAGNSKTIAVAYAVELIGVMDEARMLDWSQLVGAENAGRVMVIMGAAMILLRLVTRTAVSFKAPRRPRSRALHCSPKWTRARAPTPSSLPSRAVGIRR